MAESGSGTPIESKTSNLLIARGENVIVIIRKTNRSYRCSRCSRNTYSSYRCSRCSRIQDVKEDIRSKISNHRPNARRTVKMAAPVNGAIDIQYPDLRMELKALDLAVGVEEIACFLVLIFLLSTKEKVDCFLLAAGDCLQFR